MRDNYHERLDEITAGLVEMSKLAASAVDDATTALVDVDLAAAERVISRDGAINDLEHRLDAASLELMVRQQPVASDLRTLVTGLRMMRELERTGDYAVHLAKVARRRYPAPVIPDDLADHVREMGRLTALVTRKAGEVIATRDLRLAAELHADDDRVDELHRNLYRRLLDDGRTYDVEVIIDVTLVGRYYERLADHAVSVAGAISYLVTGKHDELEPT